MNPLKSFQKCNPQAFEEYQAEYKMCDFERNMATSTQKDDSQMDTIENSTANTSVNHSDIQILSGNKRRKSYALNNAEDLYQRPSFRILFGMFFRILVNDGYKIAGACRLCPDKIINGDINHVWSFSSHLKVCCALNESNGGKIKLRPFTIPFEHFEGI